MFRGGSSTIRLRYSIMSLPWLSINYLAWYERELIFLLLVSRILSLIFGGALPVVDKDRLRYSIMSLPWFSIKLFGLVRES